MQCSWAAIGRSFCSVRFRGLPSATEEEVQVLMQEAPSDLAVQSAVVETGDEGVWGKTRRYRRRLTLLHGVQVGELDYCWSWPPISAPAEPTGLTLKCRLALEQAGILYVGREYMLESHMKYKWSWNCTCTPNWKLTIISGAVSGSTHIHPVLTADLPTL